MYLQIPWKWATPLPAKQLPTFPWSSIPSIQLVCSWKASIYTQRMNRFADSWMRREQHAVWRVLQGQLGDKGESLSTSQSGHCMFSIFSIRFPIIASFILSFLAYCIKFVAPFPLTSFALIRTCIPRSVGPFHNDTARPPVEEGGDGLQILWVDENILNNR
jgi:hypothetical protein